MKIETEISDQMIEDQLVTALEGGSNYWYNLSDLSMCAPSDGVTPTVERIWNAVKEGKSVPINDIEDSTNHLGEINISNIREGLVLMEKESDSFNDIIDDCGDAFTADQFLQYVVMKKIVYR